eukprot:scaffold620_cov282-Pinguiococcus_pyrenoidosus.AAC.12
MAEEAARLLGFRASFLFGAVSKNPSRPLLASVTRSRPSHPLPSEEAERPGAHENSRMQRTYSNQFVRPGRADKERNLNTEWMQHSSVGVRTQAGVTASLRSLKAGICRVCVHLRDCLGQTLRSDDANPKLYSSTSMVSESAQQHTGRRRTAEGWPAH